MSNRSEVCPAIARHTKKLQAKANAEADEMLARLMNHISFDDEKGAKSYPTGSSRAHSVFGTAALRLDKGSAASGESSADPNFTQSWVEDTRKARAARRSRRGISIHHEENSGSGPRSSAGHAPYLTRNRWTKLAKAASNHVIEPEPELVSITMSPMSSTLDVPQTQSLEVQVSPLEIGSAGEADINYPWAEVKSLTSTMDEGSAPSTPPTFEAGDAYNMGDLKAALDYAVESSHICDAWRSGSHIPSAQAQSSAPPAVPVVPDASDDRKVMRTAIRNGRQSNGSVPYDRASKHKRPTVIANDMGVNLQENSAFQKKGRFEATTENIPIGVQNANSADEKPNKKKKKSRMTNCDIMNWTQDVAVQAVVY